MTAKTMPLKAALPDVSKLSGEVIHAQNGFGVHLERCFQITWLLFWNNAILENFCLLTVDLSLNKNPKVILKSSQLNMLGHFAG